MGFILEAVCSYLVVLPFSDLEWIMAYFLTVESYFKNGACMYLWDLFYCDLKLRHLCFLHEGCNVSFD